MTIFRPGNCARRRLHRTLYAITTQRLIVLTLDCDQWIQNSYYPVDLGRVDVIERSDEWGDIIIGNQQRIESHGFSLAVITPQLCGVPQVRQVASLLTGLKAQQSVLAQL